MCVLIFIHQSNQKKIFFSIKYFLFFKENMIIERMSFDIRGLEGGKYLIRGNQYSENIILFDAFLEDNTKYSLGTIIVVADSPTTKLIEVLDAVKIYLTGCDKTTCGGRLSTPDNIQNLKFFKMNFDDRIHKDIDENTPISEILSSSKYSKLDLMTNINKDYLNSIAQDQLCPICFTSLIMGYDEKNCIRLNCKHAFHKNCIRNAGGIRLDTCPICRERITSETICKSYSQYTIEDGIKYKKMKHSTKRKKKSMKSRNISKTKNRTHKRKSKKKRIY